MLFFGGSVSLCFIVVLGFVPPPMFLKVLLLGAGGAARAIVAGFAKEHAKSITIANRTLEMQIRSQSFQIKLD